MNTNQISHYLTFHQTKLYFGRLTKVTDTVGNYFTIKYTGNADTNELWATRIDYTGNEKTGLSHTLPLDYPTHPTACLPLLTFMDKK